MIFEEMMLIVYLLYDLIKLWFTERAKKLSLAFYFIYVSFIENLKPTQKF